MFSKYDLIVDVSIIYFIKLIPYTNGLQITLPIKFLTHSVLPYIKILKLSIDTIQRDMMIPSTIKLYAI